MKRLLHVIATPRVEESRTLKISTAFLEVFSKKYPDCYIDALNVTSESLPPLTVKVISGKYALLSTGELTEKLEEVWNPIKRYIERFLAANGYLITTPMWNFSIPYPLKHYIDIIVQPKYLFRYTEKGVEGLVKNRKMIVITSRGGDYSPDSAAHSYDFQESYLRAIFGFVGITNITFVNAQPMDVDREVQQAKIEEAKKIVREIAESF